MSRRLFASLLALASLLPLTACARQATLVDVQVQNQDTGAVLPLLPWHGQDYVEGQPGQRFAVVLQNLTGERVLTVLSVDGVNAISGQTAGSSQAGYVLEPWQRIEVRGWRKSYSDIAEFYFTDLPDSYAARTGRPRNVGVIGVAAFRERRYEPVPPPYYPPPQIGQYERDEQSRASGAAKAAPADAAAAAEASAPSASSPYGDRRDRALSRQELGTGHGERRYDPVTGTQFERESSRPNQVVAVYYDSYEALAARGVIPRWRGYARTEPEPFPVGFTPDPNY
jgi:hypothetical protein